MAEKLIGNSKNSNSSSVDEYLQVKNNQQFLRLLYGESSNSTLQGRERYLNWATSYSETLVWRCKRSRFRGVCADDFEAILPWVKVCRSKAGGTSIPAKKSLASASLIL
jgi:hypothetical protein